MAMTRANIPRLTQRFEAAGSDGGEIFVTRDYLDHRLALVEARARTIAAESRAELLKWVVVGVLFAQTVLIVLLAKLP